MGRREHVPAPGNAEAADTAPRPDGGIAGWVAVLAMWTKGFIWVGIVKSLGIMLPTLKDQFGTNAGTMGWVTSLIVASVGLIGPITGVLTKPFRSGYVIIICGLMFAVATIGASFTTHPLQLGLFYTILAGTASGVSAIVARETVARYFSKKYATAVGIGRTGTAVGLFVFPPLTQLFLTTYGWRGTMLLIGAISLHLTVCGALMIAAGIRRSNSYQQLPDDEPTSDPAHQPHRLTCCENCWKYSFKKLDLGLLLSCRYWAVAFMWFTMAVAYDMWLVYFVSLAEAKGFTLSEATTFITVAGVGSFIARIAQGFIVDGRIVPYRVLMGITICVIALSFCGTPWLTSYWTMMASSFLILIGNGILICLNDVLTKEVIGVDMLVGAYGWIAIGKAVLTIGLGFLPGWFYDTTGSYNAAFFMIGCVQGSSLVPLLIIQYMLHTNK